MLEKLKKTYQILNDLDDQNSKKFVLGDFENLNTTLDFDIKDYLLASKKENNYSFSNEEKDLISNIIYKIEELETKILPKANLINSFSDSLS